MNLDGCDFLLTFKCIAKCRHCPYRASPFRTGVMAVDDFRSYMKALTDEQPLNWIAFTGGEPFLFYKTLKRCIETARRLSQKEIAVFTSGHWGGSQANAQLKLQELKKAGLTSIYFSVDAFHQEFVPFHSVHTAINVARTIGFKEIVVISQFLGSIESKNPDNMKTQRYLEMLRLPEDFKIDRHVLSVEGRAADQLASFLRCKPGIPHGLCVLPDCGGKTLKDPEMIEIDFLGNVTLCPGLCIGNTKTEPLSRIIREYDYKRYPMIKLLVENGPQALAKLPEASGMVSHGKYANECHLCYELRRHLRGSYPESLAPESCYSEQ
jgi:organic radical activating enzyme